MKTAKRYSHVDCQICQNQKSNFIQNFLGRDLNVLSMYIFELLIFKFGCHLPASKLSPSSIDHNPESWSTELTDCLTARFYVPITNWEHFLTFSNVSQSLKPKNIKHILLWFMTVEIKFEPVPLPRCLKAMLACIRGNLWYLKTSGVNF